MYLPLGSMYSIQENTEMQTSAFLPMYLVLSSHYNGGFTLPKTQTTGVQYSQK